MTTQTFRHHSEYVTRCNCSDCRTTERRTTPKTALRTHARRAQLTAAERAAKAAYRNAARGDSDDRRQIIADLISDDRSPFRPEDEDSLRMMSEPTLREQRDRFLGKPEDTDDEVPDDPNDPEVRAMSAHLGYQGNERLRPLSQVLPKHLRDMPVEDDEIAGMTVFEQHDWRQRQGSRRGSGNGSPDEEPA